MSTEAVPPQRTSRITDALLPDAPAPARPADPPVRADASGRTAPPPARPQLPGAPARPALPPGPPARPSRIEALAGTDDPTARLRITPDAPEDPTARLRLAPPGRVPLPPEVPAAPPRPAAPPPTVPAGGAPPAAPPYAPAFGSPAGTTPRARPVPVRHPVRAAAALACVVLGLGLIGGAATGSWLTGDSSAHVPGRDAYTATRTLWHSAPVDSLFPRTLQGKGAGPGGADRVWTRVAAAPDGPCSGALDPLLATVLKPVGCTRVVRATYADATSSSVTTVGLVFTQGDAAAMTALRDRFAHESLDERTDLMPRAFAVPGTVAETFGDAQRASWRISVLTDVPVVVYAVSGFADGRPVDDPQPAARATAAGATSAPAQAGLGHEAEGLAEHVEKALRATLEHATEQPK
ncbi:hypothetical protein ABT160_18395 [Streptomyces sp. NPDC001941]|uniref:hypothetical protein n=1 Tax=Streptomyces sp. NPDC001941 TaxID=3154659 RepID=UPI00331DB50A